MNRGPLRIIIKYTTSLNTYENLAYSMKINNSTCTVNASKNGSMCTLSVSRVYTTPSKTIVFPQLIDARICPRMDSTMYIITYDPNNISLMATITISREAQIIIKADREIGYFGPFTVKYSLSSLYS